MKVKANIELDFTIDGDASYEDMTKLEVEQKVYGELQVFMNDFREMMHDFHGIHVDTMKRKVDVEVSD